MDRGENLCCSNMRKAHILEVSAGCANNSQELPVSFEPRPTTSSIGIVLLRLKLSLLNVRSCYSQQLYVSLAYAGLDAELL